jgi:hypothetical protein
MRFWSAALVVVLVFGSTALPAKSPNLAGGWAGPHAAIVFQGGLADVQFDCASGTIDVPVFAAKDGAFSARGTYRAGKPGPVRVGQIFRSEPANYSGKLGKDVMTLIVTLEDGTALGPFTLTQGAAPQLTRCL